MGRPTRVTCKKCGESVELVGRLTDSYQCMACGERDQIDNRRQLIAHDGPWFQHWRRQLAASLGATIAPPRDTA